MNSFGKIFKVQIFGESHGAGVGVVIDGCPPGIELTENLFDNDIKRRKAGAKGTTTRIEPDVPKILSGVFKNKTTGSPITLFFNNKNTQSSDYEDIKNIFRPSHADFTAHKKYNGFNDYRGGGHFSGRLTVGIVAAGVLAKQILSNIISIEANITEAGGNKNIQQAVEKAVSEQNSIGAIIECKAKGVPVGLGEPFWDTVESVISHAVFAIPGVKGIEFGSGFGAAKMFGHLHNDCFLNDKGTTKTNNSGGINGGITNGNDLIFRIVVKPTASISKSQTTFNFETNNMCDLKIKGRHDVCFALRVPPILESVTAISIVDLLFQNRSLQ